MSMTYLDITNEALRTVNETPMSEQQFINARSIQAEAKNAVSKIYLEINAASKEWPWLLADSAPNSTSVKTVVPAGQQRITIPESYNYVDMHSFYITDKIDGTSTEQTISQSLSMISHSEWIQRFRDEDFHESGNRELPRHVFMFPTKEYIGITPIGDKDYQIQYDAWGVPLELTNPNDIIPFPRQYRPVILRGVAMDLATFKGDTAAANRHGEAYLSLLNTMRHDLLIKQTLRIRAV